MPKSSTPSGVAVSGGHVDMALLGTALVGREIGIHEPREPKPSGSSGERPLPVVRHPEQFDDAPRCRIRQVAHELAELGFFVGMFDQVDLVDDVHEVVRLDDTPEDPVDAETQFPLRIARLAQEQRVGLVHIRVGAAGVLAIEPVERR